MRKALVLLCVSGIVTGSALADPEDLGGGVLIAHFPTEMTFSFDPPTGGWCQFYWDSLRIEDCEDQVNRIDTGNQVIWFVLAAWDEDKEWCGTEFGFGEYDSDAFVITDFSPCWPEGGLEIPTASWPGPGEGTAIVTTGAPWEGNFVPVYRFTGLAYEEGLIPVAADPATGFAGMSNCANPPESWAADSLGGMGLFQDGVYACPEGMMASGRDSEPVVHQVCPEDANFETIWDAVDAAAEGDTIELCCDYPFTGELNRNIGFGGKRLVVRSACDDPARCIIDCEGDSADTLQARRGFVIDLGDTVLIRGVTVFDGLSYGPV
jgi:hypothetical protein